MAYSRKIAATKHGKYYDPVYAVWSNMKQRCGNPRHPKYPSYGGRGIAVCDSWQSFDNFYADMGDPPAGLTLDRVNNDGNYEPGNCRWATALVQSRNQRRNVFVEYEGRERSINELCEERGMTYQLLYDRMHKLGWSLDRALTEPKKRQQRRAARYDLSLP